MVNKTRIAALLLLPVILLPVAGCAGKKVKGDTAYVARDVSTLYTLANARGKTKDIGGSTVVLSVLKTL